ncbi:MAG TPA: hypothetical protein VGB63_00855 [Pedobacter sp.]|jgi:uncharacterized membrane protein
MFKCLLLAYLSLSSFPLSPHILFFQNADSVRVVTIKVIVIPKPEITYQDDTLVNHGLKKSQFVKKKKKRELHSVKTPPVKPDEKILKTQKSGNTVVKSPNSNPIYNVQNRYYLLSLVMLVFGTMLSIFFRKGGIFILAIALIISGYYILLYSLLFIS